MQRRGAEGMARWNRRAEGGGGTAKAQENVFKQLGESVGFAEVYRVNLGVVGEAQPGVVPHRCVFLGLPGLEQGRHSKTCVGYVEKRRLRTKGYRGWSDRRNLRIVL